MSVAALHVQAGTTPHAWRPVFWLAPITALWILLTYAVPAITASGAPTVASRVSIHVLIALGLWLGLERAELTPTQRRNVWLGVMIPFTLWLAVIWGAAINGVFRAGASRIPLVPLAILTPVIIGVPVLLRSRRLGQVLDAMPASWLIALQAYRVLGSAFLVGWALGFVPGIFALPAGTGDVITGLLALPAAIAVAAGTSEGRRVAIAWNIFGLLDFTVAVSIGLATAPGPLQVIVPSVPNATTGIYPTVMIPAFAVPASILLHTLSLRQLYRRARQAAATLA